MYKMDYLKERFSEKEFFCINEISCIINTEFVETVKDFADTENGVFFWLSDNDVALIRKANKVIPFNASVIYRVMGCDNVLHDVACPNVIDGRLFGRNVLDMNEIVEFRGNIIYEHKCLYWYGKTVD